MAINELRSLQNFARIAELGSLRQAAQAQGTTPQAVSKALAQLEQHLGVRLLHRTTRSLALTEEGRQLLEAAQPGLHTLQMALHSAQRSKDAIAGPLRIVGPRSVFVPVLAPLLHTLTQRHPQVQPDVQLDDRIGNWVQERVDVGFRIGASPQEGVVARKLFALQLIICAAPAYLRRHGVPRQLADLADPSLHRCTAFRSPRTGQIVPWRVQQGQTVAECPVPAALCVNDEELELQAALDGSMVAQLTNVAAAAHIRAGRLVPLLPRHVATPTSLFIYYGHRAAQPSRVRAFVDLVVEQLADGTDYVLNAKELKSPQYP